MREKEGPKLLADLFNTLSDEQKIGLPHTMAGQIRDYLVESGFRIVFGRWYKQERPSPFRNR